MSTPKKKIKAPAPRVEPGTTNSPRRRVEVPSTVGRQDTTAGDNVPLVKTRASFREEEFVRVIRQHGKFVIWRKALLCPCFNPETEQAVLACESCDGSGYLFVDPHAIQAVMLQFDKKTSIYERFGLYQQGTVQVTVEPKYRLGYRDSIELLDAVIPMNELLIRGDRRGRRSKLPAGVDSARFRIRDVSAALYRDDAGRVVALQKGIHFDITDEGWIRWLTAADVVPEGGVFSLHYDFHPIFLVISWIHVTRDDVSGRKATSAEPRVISLPVSAMAQLLFLTDVNAVPSMDPVAKLPSGFGPGGPDA